MIWVQESFETKHQSSPANYYLEESRKVTRSCTYKMSSYALREIVPSTRHIFIMPVQTSKISWRRSAAVHDVLVMPWFRVRATIRKVYSFGCTETYQKMSSAQFNPVDLRMPNVSQLSIRTLGRWIAHRWILNRNRSIEKSRFNMTMLQTVTGCRIGHVHVGRKPPRDHGKCLLF